MVRTEISLFLKNAPGELGKLATLLGKEGVNIDALYVLRSNSDGIELAVVLDEHDEALPNLAVTGGVLTV